MKYGLIGEHLPHSFSREIHGKLADYEYELSELAPGELEGFFKRADFCAINVTIPYKQAVMPYLTYIHPQARAIGAVNTVVNRGGELYGYNTDLFGMIALIGRIGIDIEGQKVLILGSGGTAATAKVAAELLGASQVLTVGRRHDASRGVISYENAYELHTDAEFIINTTPCGMFPYEDGGEGISSVPINLLSFPYLRGTVDVVYNPLRTNFVLDSRVPSEGGLYMLVAQAVYASALFLGTADEPNAEMFKTIDKVYREILREKENIVLIGMPGCGKTTVGRALAQRLGREFVDTDEMIERKTGKRVSEIFAEKGELYFRKLEKEAVCEASRLRGAIIATGGGAILNDQNVRALKRSGRIYFIERELENIVPTPDRPLSMTKEQLRALYRCRRERYLGALDRLIRSDEVLEHTVSAIMEDFFR